VKAESVAYLRHETEPINKLGVAVAFFFTNAVSDYVGLAGKPARVGLARLLPLLC
jgi:hypothetical protein